VVSATVQDPKELELKFECDPADADAIAGHPVLAAARSERRRLVSLYFDTGDWALRKGGVVLRVRDTGERFVQTIKSIDGTGELFERSEWEKEVEGRNPDLDAASGTALAPLLDERVRECLRPIFATWIERTTYQLNSNGSEIEVALDRGAVATDRRQSPVCELELELKQGDPAELFHLARAIAVDVPLRLGVKSKAERGFELANGDTPEFERAAKLKLDAGMTAREAFRAIAQNCLRQIVANAPASCAGHVEALHHMRIGLRRFRAAIGAFAEVTADARQKKIESALTWITKQLGPARDLDVFAADMLEQLSEDRASDETLAEAQRAFGERREQAYAEAAEAIGSGRFRAALLDAAEWIEVGSWSTAQKLRALRERPVKTHAAKEIARQRKRVRKRGKHLRELSAGKRHKLRIAAKNLRYAIEFFASLFPDDKNTKRRQAALSALKDLQDALGALNDIVARENLMSEGHASQVHALAHAVSEAQKERKVAALLDEAVSAYDRFAAVKPFRR
jgi:inorganic triphosphatase YgiF